MTNGFLRIASVSPLHRVADVEHNLSTILSLIKSLDEKGVEIALFPELAITGYTCADLFHNHTLLSAAADALQCIAEFTRTLQIHVIVGAPRMLNGTLRNSAAFISSGNIQFVDKTYLPNYNEFYEKRWFSSATEESPLIHSHGAYIGIEICEDLWAPVPPSCSLALRGAQVIFNLSASNDLIGKHNYLLSLIRQQSARCLCAYAYASAGFGESTTDLVFLPKTIICENGTLLAENDREDYLDNSFVIADIDIEAIERDRLHSTTFNDAALRSGITQFPQLELSSDYDVNLLPAFRSIDPHPFVPPTDALINERCREIVTIQESGLAARLSAIGQPKIVVGVSGGLDSTLALLVAAATMKKLNRPASDIIAITMPGFGTTDRTYTNALTLMTQLGVTKREIPIAPAVRQHFSDIGHDPATHDVTYENSQARERTQILMDVANQVGGIVLGTGDLSELALGWATYNGDQMSMYGINAGVPKTLVKFLVRHYASRTIDTNLKKALADIINTPISPELIPANPNGEIVQKTESFVGPYELNDFFLYYTLRYGFSPKRIFILARKAFDTSYTPTEILKWLKVFYRRFFSQQFKRSCMPDGPKVGSVCLSPRGDWRMPSDASSALWTKEVDSINLH
ncbi:MAG: NAD(+) synthase [Firmicutes bacterium]|nr:NAD(+) synthase [Bacillota bacterium]MCM1401399.1 NAD(+) synthase [Bacteroides sp.]MCM1477331.1 NAD(+) synthase [Bacteroides sp.]